MEKLISQTNFKLLKAQKIILRNLQDKRFITKEESNAIDGILNLIDEVQSIAVDQFGHGEDEVFNLIGSDKYVNLKAAKQIVTSSLRTMCSSSTGLFSQPSV